MPLELDELDADIPPMPLELDADIPPVPLELDAELPPVPAPPIPPSPPALPELEVAPEAEPDDVDVWVASPLQPAVAASDNEMVHKRYREGVMFGRYATRI
jgi:hypothetical protein